MSKLHQHQIPIRMDWECSRCDVPHGVQIGGLSDTDFQSFGRQDEGWSRGSRLVTLLNSEVKAKDEESASLEDARRQL